MIDLLLHSGKTGEKGTSAGSFVGLDELIQQSAHFCADHRESFQLPGGLF